MRVACEDPQPAGVISTADGPVDKLIAFRHPRPAKVETSPWWLPLRPLRAASPTRHCCLSTPLTSQLASQTFHQLKASTQQLEHLVFCRCTHRDGLACSAVCEVALFGRTGAPLEVLALPGMGSRPGSGDLSQRRHGARSCCWRPARPNQMVHLLSRLQVHVIKSCKKRHAMALSVNCSLGG